MTPRSFFALRTPILLLAAAITAAGQVPTSAPATATTNEPRTFALRSLNESSAGADAVDIAVYRNALRLAPNDPGLYNNLGYAYARQQNYEEAVRMLERAISLNPKLAAAHYNLGIVYEHLGQLPLSLRATREAVATDPQHLQARVHLCELHLELGQSNEAVDCYENLLKAAPQDARSRSNYGSALRRARRLHDALVSLEQTIELFPASAEAYNQLGVVLFETRRYDKAIVTLKRALELATNLDEPRYNLALAELANRNKPAALEQYAFLKRNNSSLAQQLHAVIYRKQLLPADR